MEANEQRTAGLGHHGFGRGRRARWQRSEEILQELWMAEEDHREVFLDDLTRELRWPDAAELVHGLAAEGLVSITNGKLLLTEAGRQQATALVRCHRLAERLLRDVLDVAEQQSEASACRLEHILSHEVADSICTLLGHPLTCPHGRPIPRGECCRAARNHVESLVIALSELPSGGRGRVAYIATRHHSRLDRLAALGLIPGAVVQVHQRRPAFIIQLNETQLAIDEEIAADIFVRRL